MDIVYSTLYFLLALTILIAVHEWGHFIVARMVGVKVLRFAIGFGKTIFSYKGKKGTEYVLGMVPLGGYIKMLDEDEAEVDSADLDQAFNRKPIWARMAIVIAGPALNFIFAVFALWLMFIIGIKSLAPIVGEVTPSSISQKANIQKQDEIIFVGDKAVRSWREFQIAMMTKMGDKEKLPITVKNTKTGSINKLNLDLKNWHLDPKKPDVLQSLGIKAYIPYLKPIIGSVVKDKPAAKAGMKSGDLIQKINNIKIKHWYQLLQIVQASGNKPILMEVLRNGKNIKLSLIPELKLYNNKDVGFIGASVKQQFIVANWLRNQKYSITTSLAMALSETKNLTVTSFQMIGKFISGKVSLRNIGGPIGIAQGAGQSAKIGLAYYLSFLALISISLGVINILPVPMLDGGHLLFFMVEAIIGRPLSKPIREQLMVVGIVLLLSLMVLAMFNDISRLIF